MSQPLEDDVFRRLADNIDALAPSLDAASSDGCSSPTLRLIPLSQTRPSKLNGVCIPQRKYDKGAARGAPNHQNLVPFVRQDGTYISVDAAIRGDYAGLVLRDIPGLYGAGYTITLRFEVSRSAALCETIEPIACIVARVPTARLSGELSGVTLLRRD